MYQVQTNINPSTERNRSSAIGLSDLPLPLYLRHLITKGATVDSLEKDNSTPLHKAAFAGHTDCVQYLIESGANVNAADNAGKVTLISPPYL